eukprot:TRINITY_DN16569_c0_g2_i1.p1 TRINITY_DN16569_c0_g2~~TRINITY_DN16569_c0_g2_i1.p1  ORF type:complete len:122 (-),score=15.85 TRINITY_DN16569_c0_g2_i1:10-375(-)
MKITLVPITPKTKGKSLHIQKIKIPKFFLLYLWLLIFPENFTCFLKIWILNNTKHQNSNHNPIHLKDYVSHTPISDKMILFLIFMSLINPTMAMNNQITSNSWQIAFLNICGLSLGYLKFI